MMTTKNQNQKTNNNKRFGKMSAHPVKKMKKKEKEKRFLTLTLRTWLMKASTTLKIRRMMKMKKIRKKRLNRKIKMIRKWRMKRT